MRSTFLAVAGGEELTVDQILTDGQAKACSSKPSCGARVSLRERLEEACLDIVRNPNASVLYDKFYLHIVVGLAQNMDRQLGVTAFRCELDAIGY
jgi:hypothetical protein